MNSLRSAWTPVLAGLMIPGCRRRETPKLNSSDFVSRYTLYRTGTKHRAGQSRDNEDHAEIYSHTWRSYVSYSSAGIRCGCYRNRPQRPRSRTLPHPEVPAWVEDASFAPNHRPRHNTPSGPSG